MLLICCVSQALCLGRTVDCLSPLEVCMATSGAKKANPQGGVIPVYTNSLNELFSSGLTILPQRDKDHLTNPHFES